MDYLIEQYNNHTTKSFLISGARDDIVSEIKRRFQGEVYLFNHSDLGIDDVRALQNMTLTLSDEGKYALLIISFYKASEEAQNSLLKFLEEGKRNISISVVVPTDVFLLPTVRSRLEKVTIANDSDDLKMSKFAKEILMEKPWNRISNKKISMLLERKIGDQVKPDREALESILSYISMYAYDYERENLSKASSELSRYKSTSNILHSLSSQNSSPKMLVEFVLLSLPEVSL